MGPPFHNPAKSSAVREVAEIQGFIGFFSSNLVRCRPASSDWIVSNGVSKIAGPASVTHNRVTHTHAD